jgi:hypothetical protein
MHVLLPSARKGASLTVAASPLVDRTRKSRGPEAAALRPSDVRCALLRERRDVEGQVGEYRRGGHEGKIKHLPRRSRRYAIYVAMLFGKYPNEIRVTKPPNAVFKALALFGKVLRFNV